MRQKLGRITGLALAMAVLLTVLFPLAAFAAEAPPEVGADAYIVMDAATGQILVAKNPDKMEYPASITKIMTLALALEYVNLETEGDAPVTCSQAAVEALIHRATMIALEAGEVCTVRDLMYATMIESANDAANVLAEHIGGSMDAFAQLMNEKARALGLSNTFFVNPSGQPDANHATTAYDMAVITRWALGVPGFRQLFGAMEYSMGATNLRPQGRVFHNANLIQVPQSGYYCDGVIGSKSGYTDDALYTLVTVAERGGTELICVSLNNPYNADKYTSTNELLNYCFANFNRVSYPMGDLDEQQLPVFGGGSQPLGQIDVYGKGEVSILLHRSLGLGAVQLSPLVPENYIIGQDFAPMVVLSLPEDCPYQYGGQLLTVPLSWRGLEEILAANTSFGENLASMAGDEPVVFWLVVALITLLVGLLAGRIVYVRARREKRRRQRLEAARAQMPIRIAPRPAPPARTIGPRGMEQRRAGNRAQSPQLSVVGTQKESAPRRVGRAR